MSASDDRIPAPRPACAPAASHAPRSQAGAHREAHPRPAALAAALAGAGTIGYMLPALAGSWQGLRAPLGVEDRTASGRGYALTFDDGPHPQGTPAVLEILAREGVHATFFLVGEQVLGNPALAGEIAAQGHGIGLHCHRHRNLLRLTPRQVREDIARAYEAIASHAGSPIALYRPPYGVLNGAALRLSRAYGWRTLLWTQWGRDWQAQATPETIAALVSDGATEGSVLLLHDADYYSAPGSWRRTVAALPRVLDALAERGLQPVAP